MPTLKQLNGRENEYANCLVAKDASQVMPHFEKGKSLFARWKELTTKVQDSQGEINRLSAEYRDTKNKSLIEESKKVGEGIKETQKELTQLSIELEKLELILPNWIADDVPRGIGDEFAKPIRYSGVPKVWPGNSDFSLQHPGVNHLQSASEPLKHHQILSNLIDQERAGEVAQSRFYYEKGDIVLLDFAISMYAIEFFKNRLQDPELLLTPYLMRKSMEERITYFEAFQNTIFELEKDGLLLIPSSEHSIVARYADKIFNKDELPQRVIAWSPCFRKEAGAYGKETKGIFRVKQFHKVEIHSIMRKGEDLQEIDKLTGDVQDFLDTLGLPNRSIIVPSGDMDKRAFKQIDVETWMPGEGKYRETHSIATLDTWVSEKLKIRYREENKNKEFTRNVYATAAAVQRLMCAIAENHYNSSTNSIDVPFPLQKYMMGVQSIKVDG